MELRGLKYIFYPICIYKNIHLRKRLLHKGYSLLSVTEHIDISNNNELTFELIVCTNTLKQTETYLKNEYGIDVIL